MPLALIMHDLDTLSSYDVVDKAHMHLRLEALPEQCAQSYAAGQQLALPAAYAQAQQVVIAGMGGSGVGASLVRVLCAPLSACPITTWRTYGLPAYAAGAHTLVIATSKSGDTEETLSAFDEAVQRGCAVIALATGGALAQRARDLQIPLLAFTFADQPREAIGWLTFPLLAILAHLGFIPDPSADVNEAVTLMRETGARIGPNSPAVRNPVKRMAGQVMDRLPIIFGAGMLAPVARRWKTTLNETAKLLAAWDELPELNHNSVVGLLQPEAVWQKTIVIQLRCNNDSPRVSQRFDLTTRLMLECGINQDTVRAKGKSALAQMFSLIQFGDWMSYYAAIMSGIDPTPTDPITWLKQGMGEIED
ncbi:MAG TPA: bifunctional phosphoglucose/phosphomannose isomerase [Anaerolineae bacterium]